MVAFELNAILIADDSRVIEKAKELGIKAIKPEQLLTSSLE